MSSPTTVLLQNAQTTTNTTILRLLGHVISGIISNNPSGLDYLTLYVESGGVLDIDLSFLIARQFNHMPTLLLLASFMSADLYVKKLIELGADYQYIDPIFRRNALHLACMTPHWTQATTHTIRLLLQLTIKHSSNDIVNSLDVFGLTPIAYLILSPSQYTVHHFNSLKRMINHGAITHFFNVRLPQSYLSDSTINTTDTNNTIAISTLPQYYLYHSLLAKTNTSTATTNNTDTTTTNNNNNDNTITTPPQQLPLYSTPINPNININNHMSQINMVDTHLQVKLCGGTFYPQINLLVLSFLSTHQRFSTNYQRIIQHLVDNTTVNVPNSNNINANNNSNIINHSLRPSPLHSSTLIQLHSKSTPNNSINTSQINIVQPHWRSKIMTGFIPSIRSNDFNINNPLYLSPLTLPLTHPFANFAKQIQTLNRNIINVVKNTKNDKNLNVSNALPKTILNTIFQYPDLSLSMLHFIFSLWGDLEIYLGQLKDDSAPHHRYFFNFLMSSRAITPQTINIIQLCFPLLFTTVANPNDDVNREYFSQSVNHFLQHIPQVPTPYLFLLLDYLLYNIPMTPDRTRHWLQSDNKYNKFERYQTNNVYTIYGNKNDEKNRDEKNDEKNRDGKNHDEKNVQKNHILNFNHNNNNNNTSLSFLSSTSQSKLHTYTLPHQTSYIIDPYGNNTHINPAYPLTMVRFYPKQHSPFHVPNSTLQQTSHHTNHPSQHSSSHNSHDNSPHSTLTNHTSTPNLQRSQSRTRSVSRVRSKKSEKSEKSEKNEKNEKSEKNEKNNAFDTPVKNDTSSAPSSRLSRSQFSRMDDDAINSINSGINTTNINNYILNNNNITNENSGENNNNSKNNNETSTQNTNIIGKVQKYIEIPIYNFTPYSFTLSNPSLLPLVTEQSSLDKNYHHRHSLRSQISTQKHHQTTPSSTQSPPLPTLLPIPPMTRRIMENLVHIPPKTLSQLTTIDFSPNRLKTTKALIAHLRSGCPSPAVVLYLIARHAYVNKWHVLDIPRLGQISPLMLLLDHYQVKSLDMAQASCIRFIPDNCNDANNKKNEQNTNHNNKNDAKNEQNISQNNKNGDAHTFHTSPSNTDPTIPTSTHPTSIVHTGSELIQIISILLDAGADVMKRDENNLSVIWYLLQNPYIPSSDTNIILNMLHEHGYPCQLMYIDALVWMVTSGRVLNMTTPTPLSQQTCLFLPLPVPIPSFITSVMTQNNKDKHGSYGSYPNSSIFDHRNDIFDEKNHENQNNIQESEKLIQIDPLSFTKTLYNTPLPTTSDPYDHSTVPFNRQPIPPLLINALRSQQQQLLLNNSSQNLQNLQNLSSAQNNYENHNLNSSQNSSLTPPQPITPIHSPYYVEPITTTPIQGSVTPIISYTGLMVLIDYVVGHGVDISASLTDLFANANTHQCTAIAINSVVDKVTRKNSNVVWERGFVKTQHQKSCSKNDEKNNDEKNQIEKNSTSSFHTTLHLDHPDLEHVDSYNAFEDDDSELVAATNLILLSTPNTSNNNTPNTSNSSHTANISNNASNFNNFDDENDYKTPGKDKNDKNIITMDKYDELNLQNEHNTQLLYQQLQELTPQGEDLEFFNDTFGSKLLSSPKNNSKNTQDSYDNLTPRSKHNKIHFNQYDFYADGDGGNVNHDKTDSNIENNQGLIQNSVNSTPQQTHSHRTPRFHVVHNKRNDPYDPSDHFSPFFYYFPEVFNYNKSRSSRDSTNINHNHTHSHVKTSSQSISSRNKHDIAERNPYSSNFDSENEHNNQKNENNNQKNYDSDSSALNFTPISTLPPMLKSFTISFFSPSHQSPSSSIYAIDSSIFLLFLIFGSYKAHNAQGLFDTLISYGFNFGQEQLNHSISLLDLIFTIITTSNGTIGSSFGVYLFNLLTNALFANNYNPSITTLFHSELLKSIFTPIGYSIPSSIHPSSVMSLSHSGSSAIFTTGNNHNSSSLNNSSLSSHPTTTTSPSLRSYLYPPIITSTSLNTSMSLQTSQSLLPTSPSTLLQPSTTTTSKQYQPYSLDTSWTASITQPSQALGASSPTLSNTNGVVSISSSSTTTSLLNITTPWNTQPVKQMLYSEKPQQRFQFIALQIYFTFFLSFSMQDDDSITTNNGNTNNDKQSTNDNKTTQDNNTGSLTSKYGFELHTAMSSTISTSKPSTKRSGQGVQDITTRAADDAYANIKKHHFQLRKECPLVYSPLITLIQPMNKVADTVSMKETIHDRETKNGPKNEKGEKSDQKDEEKDNGEKDDNNLDDERTNNKSTGEDNDVIIDSYIPFSLIIIPQVIDELSVLLPEGIVEQLGYEYSIGKGKNQKSFFTNSIDKNEKDAKNSDKNNALNDQIDYGLVNTMSNLNVLHINIAQLQYQDGQMRPNYLQKLSQRNKKSSNRTKLKHDAMKPTQLMRQPLYLHPSNRNQATSSSAQKNNKYNYNRSSTTNSSSDNHINSDSSLYVDNEIFNEKDMIKTPICIDLSHLIHTNVPYSTYTVEIIKKLSLPYASSFIFTCCPHHTTTSIYPLLQGLLEQSSNQPVNNIFFELFSAIVQLYSIRDTTIINDLLQTEPNLAVATNLDDFFNSDDNNVNNDDETNVNQHVLESRFPGLFINLDPQYRTLKQYAPMKGGTIDLGLIKIENLLSHPLLYFFNTLFDPKTIQFTSLLKTILMFTPYIGSGVRLFEQMIKLIPKNAHYRNLNLTFTQNIQVNLMFQPQITPKARSGGTNGQNNAFSGTGSDDLLVKNDENTEFETSSHSWFLTMLASPHHDIAVNNALISNTINDGTNNKVNLSSMSNLSSLVQFLTPKNSNFIKNLPQLISLPFLSYSEFLTFGIGNTIFDKKQPIILSNSSTTSGNHHNMHSHHKSTNNNNSYNPYYYTSGRSGMLHINHTIVGTLYQSFIATNAVANASIDMFDVGSSSNNNTNIGKYNSGINISHLMLNNGQNTHLSSLVNFDQQKNQHSTISSLTPTSISPQYTATNVTLSTPAVQTTFVPISASIVEIFLSRLIFENVSFFHLFFANQYFTRQLRHFFSHPEYLNSSITLNQSILTYLFNPLPHLLNAIKNISVNNTSNNNNTNINTPQSPISITKSTATTNSIHLYHAVLFCPQSIIAALPEYHNNIVYNPHTKPYNDMLTFDLSRPHEPNPLAATPTSILFNLILNALNISPQLPFQSTFYKGLKSKFQATMGSNVNLDTLNASLSSLDSTLSSSNTNKSSSSWFSSLWSSKNQNNDNNNNSTIISMDSTLGTNLRSSSLASTTLGSYSSSVATLPPHLLPSTTLTVALSHSTLLHTSSLSLPLWFITNGTGMNRNGINFWVQLLHRGGLDIQDATDVLIDENYYNIILPWLQNTFQSINSNLGYFNYISGNSFIAGWDKNELEKNINLQNFPNFTNFEKINKGLLFVPHTTTYFPPPSYQSTQRYNTIINALSAPSSSQQGLPRAQALLEVVNLIPTFHTFLRSFLTFLHLSINFTPNSPIVDFLYLILSHGGSLYSHDIMRMIYMLNPVKFITNDTTSPKQPNNNDEKNSNNNDDKLDKITEAQPDDFNAHIPPTNSITAFSLPSARRKSAVAGAVSSPRIEHKVDLKSENKSVKNEKKHTSFLPMSFSSFPITSTATALIPSPPSLVYTNIPLPSDITGKFHLYFSTLNHYYFFLNSILFYQHFALTPSNKYPNVVVALANHPNELVRHAFFGKGSSGIKTITNIDKNDKNGKNDRRTSTFNSKNQFFTTAEMQCFELLSLSTCMSNREWVLATILSSNTSSSGNVNAQVTQKNDQKATMYDDKSDARNEPYVYTKAITTRREALYITTELIVNQLIDVIAHYTSDMTENNTVSPNQSSSYEPIPIVLPPKSVLNPNIKTSPSLHINFSLIDNLPTPYHNNNNNNIITSGVTDVMVSNTTHNDGGFDGTVGILWYLMNYSIISCNDLLMLLLECQINPTLGGKLSPSSSLLSPTSHVSISNVVAAEQNSTVNEPDTNKNEENDEKYDFFGETLLQLIDEMYNHITPSLSTLHRYTSRGENILFHAILRSSGGHFIGLTNTMFHDDSLLYITPPTNTTTTTTTVNTTSNSPSVTTDTTVPTPNNTPNDNKIQPQQRFSTLTPTFQGQVWNERMLFHLLFHMGVWETIILQDKFGRSITDYLYYTNAQYYVPNFYFFVMKCLHLIEKKKKC